MWTTLVLFKNKIERDGYVIFHIDDWTLKTIQWVVVCFFPLQHMLVLLFPWCLDKSCRVFKFLYILLFFFLTSHSGWCAWVECVIKALVLGYNTLFVLNTDTEKVLIVRYLLAAHIKSQYTFLTDIWSYLDRGHQVRTHSGCWSLEPCYAFGETCFLMACSSDPILCNLYDFI